MESNKSPITLTSFVEQINDHLSHIYPLNKANAEDIIQYVRDFMTPKRIKISYEHLSCLENARSFRIVLTTNRAKANFGVPLVRECNGAIILIEEFHEEELSKLRGKLRCRLICRPAHEFNPKVNNAQWVNTNIKNGLYEIYFIEDGSTVNLSYLQTSPTEKGQWILSSKNSFDSSNMVWRGKSYGEALTEVLANYPEFSYEKLDPYKTYTIGFKHPAHHPFGQHNGPVLLAWFIQSTHVESGEVSYSDKIGLPFQEKTRISAQGGQFWQTIKHKAQDALEEYTKDRTARPLLGYILRTKDSNRTRHYSDILVESTLLSEIRNCVYQLPFISNKVMLERAKENFKDINYVVVEAYLDITRRPVFELLFPQYKAQYEQYDQLLDQAVDGIYNVLKKDIHGIKYTPKEDPPSVLDKLIMTFASIASGHISLNVREKFSMGDRPPAMGSTWPKETAMVSQEEKTKKLIRSTIVHPKYADKYVQIF